MKLAKRQIVKSYNTTISFLGRLSKQCPLPVNSKHFQEQHFFHQGCKQRITEFILCNDPTSFNGSHAVLLF